MNIVKLAVDCYKGAPAGNYSRSDNMETLRQALIDANHGKDRVDPRDLRDGKCSELFALMETIIQKATQDGLTGDEFFMDFVEERNLALGDSDVFHVEDTSLFTVANIAEGTKGIRRQKIEGGQDIKVSTSLKGVRIYEEANRLLSGRVDMATFIDRVAKSFTARDLDEIYATFIAAMDKVETPYTVSGSFDEDKLMTAVDHIEAATGNYAKIIGTRAALRKVSTAIQSDEMKSDMYNMGYFGKCNGVPMISMRQRHKVNTTDFILPGDALYIVASEERFIKRVTEGETYVELTGMYVKQDFTQEYMMTQRNGIGVIMNSVIGVYTLS